MLSAASALGFVKAIVLTTASTSHVERVLADFDDASRQIGLRLYFEETMFMRNITLRIQFMLNGKNISDCSKCVQLRREVNMINNLAPALTVCFAFIEVT